VVQETTQIHKWLFTNELNNGDDRPSCLTINVTDYRCLTYNVYTPGLI